MRSIEKIGHETGFRQGEQGMGADNISLPVQGFQVVGERQQIELRRQLVLRMAPIAIVEDAELARVDEDDGVVLGVDAGLHGVPRNLGGKR